MDIAKTEIIEIVYVAEANALLCTVDNRKLTKENLMETLAVIQATVNTYNSQGVQLKWCWDLSNITLDITKGGSIQTIHKELLKIHQLISDTIRGAAIVFSSSKLSSIFNGLIKILDIEMPTKVFSKGAVPKAMEWLSGVEIRSATPGRKPRRKFF